MKDDRQQILPAGSPSFGHDEPMVPSPIVPYRTKDGEAIDEPIELIGPLIELRDALDAEGLLDGRPVTHYLLTQQARLVAAVAEGRLDPTQAEVMRRAYMDMAKLAGVDKREVRRVVSSAVNSAKAQLIELRERVRSEHTQTVEPERRPAHRLTGGGGR